MRKREDYFNVLLAISCIIIPILYFTVTNNEKNTASLDNEATINIMGEDTGVDEAGDEQNETDDKNRIDQEDDIQYTESQVDDMQYTEDTINKVDASYFDDALFIGDSRTVGISEYGTLSGATFFANAGMSVYNIGKDAVFVSGKGKVKLSNLLEEYNYGKIYIMLGINELGYNFEQNIKKYGEIIEQLSVAEPNAIIYIQANLHVTKSRNDRDKIFNNKMINRFNDAIKQFADNKKIYYIDVNPEFDDNDGNLHTKYSTDGTHPLGKYYTTWCDWLKENTIEVKKK